VVHQDEQGQNAVLAVFAEAVAPASTGLEFGPFL
jgi:hypothetical protein